MLDVQLFIQTNRKTFKQIPAATGLVESARKCSTGSTTIGVAVEAILERLSEERMGAGQAEQYNSTAGGMRWQAQEERQLQEAIAASASAAPVREDDDRLMQEALARSLEVDDEDAQLQAALQLSRASLQEAVAAQLVIDSSEDEARDPVSRVPSLVSSLVSDRINRVRFAGARARDCGNGDDV
eukprot:Skav204960  [mRNA]  locus=scaffold3104:594094:603543:+ [translate_table: standard]